MRTLLGMTAIGNETTKTVAYDAAKLRVHFGTTPPPPSPEYDVVQVEPVIDDGPPLPPGEAMTFRSARLCCGPDCQRCTKIVCDDASPPPPTVPPATPMHLVVWKQGRTLGIPFTTFEVGGGPIVSIEDEPGMTLDTIRQRIFQQIGPQAPSIVLHLFRVVGTAPLFRSTIIAIPVAGQAI